MLLLIAITYTQVVFGQGSTPDRLTPLGELTMLLSHNPNWTRGGVYTLLLDAFDISFSAPLMFCLAV